MSNVTELLSSGGLMKALRLASYDASTLLEVEVAKGARNGEEPLDAVVLAHGAPGGGDAGAFACLSVHHRQPSRSAATGVR